MNHSVCHASRRSESIREFARSKGQHCQSCSNSLKNNVFYQLIIPSWEFLFFSYLVSQKFLGYCIFSSGAHRTRVSLNKKQKSFWLRMRPLNSFNLAKSLSQHFRWSIKTWEAYWTDLQNTISVWIYINWVSCAYFVVRKGHPPAPNYLRAISDASST